MFPSYKLPFSSGISQPRLMTPEKTSTGSIAGVHGHSGASRARRLRKHVEGNTWNFYDFFTWISPMPIMPIAQNICGSGFPISTRSFGGNMPQSRIEARPEPEHSGHFERWPSCPFRGYFYKLITFW